MSTPGDDDPSGSPPPRNADEAAAEQPSVVVDPALVGRPFATTTSDTETILPASIDDSLREAVGVRVDRKARKKARKEQRAREAEAKRQLDSELDDDGNPVKRSRTAMIVAGVSIAVGAGIAALVLLGRVNSERYVLDCTTTAAVAEQGRAFPPWGTRPLAGAQWRPIALPANAQCKTEELDDITKLETKFLDLLLDRTSAALTVRNFLDTITADTRPNPLDVIAAQLEQALLLSRAPERGDLRKQVERMQGDVQYWRASVRLRDATTALVDASRQFDAAALQRPLHVSDAGAWAELLRRITDEVRAGPNGAAAAFPPAPTGDAHVTAPQGTALPVEPPPPAAGSDAPPTPPDAGVPTGGVLL